MTLLTDMNSSERLEASLDEKYSVDTQAPSRSVTSDHKYRHAPSAARGFPGQSHTTSKDQWGSWLVVTLKGVGSRRLTNTQLKKQARDALGLSFDDMKL